MITTGQEPVSRYIKIFVIAILTVWFIFFFFHPIDLIPVDLGRHITNGRIFFTQPERREALLHTNLYSFATPTAPFVNHHWLTGTVFFIIWKLAGFAGLGLFHLLVNLVTFLLFFRLAARRSNFAIASIIGVMIVPLLAERTEIRPEIFSYLGIALYLTILNGFVEGRFRARALLWLTPVQIFWVNAHIYFFLGPFITGIYWLVAFSKKLSRPDALKPLTLILLGIVGASLLNPSGIHGFLYPLRIFGNYAFLVSENQSVRQYFASGRGYYNLYNFIILFAVTIIGFIIAYVKERRRLIWTDVLFTAIFGVWAFLSVRNLTLYGYTAWVALAGVIAIIKTKPIIPRRFAIVFLLACLAAFLAGFSRVRTLAPATYLGVVENNKDAAAFIREHDIKGPLFNDFDIGGYTIFYLYPAIHPFVDNRPEAYPAAFMTETYIAMQTDPAEWDKQLKKYQFNAILFSFEDKAPWAVGFIVGRLLDPEWAPVYADNFAIIFLRRNEQNAALIKQYEISKERFSLEETK